MQETQETQIQFLGQKDSLEKEMAIHSTILAWKIPWTEEPGGLQCMEPQRVRHDTAHTHRSLENVAVSTVGNTKRSRRQVEEAEKQV